MAESPVALPPVSVKSRYAVSHALNPALECSAQVPDNTPVLICPSCGDTMQHLRTIPKFGARLEQFIFVCPSCEEVEIKEVKLGGIRGA